MKNFSIFLIIALAISFSAKAQNKILDYTFSGLVSDTVYDQSDYGNNGLLVGNVTFISSGIVRIGKDSEGYLDVPYNVIDGLNDFTMVLKVQTGNFHTEGINPMNTIFSASNSSCTYCFGLAYNKVNSGWEITLNGVKHTFPQELDILGTSGITITLMRDAGVVSLTYSYNNIDILLGTFNDATALNASTFIFGQHEHCEGGCFHQNQSINGGYNRIRIWDGPMYLKHSVDLQSAIDYSVFPNPVSSATTISFSLQQTSHTTITLLDVAGRKINTVLDENLDEGNHEVNLNRESLDAGVYFLQLQTGSSTVTEKIVVE